MRLLNLRFAWPLSIFIAALGLLPVAARSATTSGAAEVATWTCTGSPCPWGGQLSGFALTWPDAQSALNARFGYTVNSGVYYPAARANGLTISVSYGSATLYAGLPDAPSHRAIAALNEGASHVVSGLVEGEVLSLQSGTPFGYTVVSPDPAPPADPTPPPPPPPSDPSVNSQPVTWTCTGSPCPWGSPLQGQAVVWPASASPSQQRLGYTANSGIYLPATYANGMVFKVLSAAASVYAGGPHDGSHRLLATLSPGTADFKVSGLASGEVLSVQSDQAFTFAATAADPAAPGNPADPGTPPGGGAAKSSAVVTWTCESSPCPWGSPLSGQALVWPSDLLPTSQRLGYTTSAGAYLPSEYAGGVSVKLLSGSATAYAGYPSAPSHRVLGPLTAGQTITFSGLSAGEVISLQNSDAFTYEITVTSVPTPPSQEGVIQSVPAVWRCNTPGCTATDWQSAVITWPASTAYENNARSGDNSRTVYSHSGELLYPYMGAWANGCQVTAVSGTVLIIEWQRGTDQWRSIWLNPGQTHTIQLTSPENGAMIETLDGWAPSFSVRLNNCTPQQIR